MPIGICFADIDKIGGNVIGIDSTKAKILSNMCRIYNRRILMDKIIANMLVHEIETEIVGRGKLGRINEEEIFGINESKT